MGGLYYSANDIPYKREAINLLDSLESIRGGRDATLTTQLSQQAVQVSPLAMNLIKSLLLSVLKTKAPDFFPLWLKFIPRHPPSTHNRTLRPGEVPWHVRDLTARQTPDIRLLSIRQCFLHAQDPPGPGPPTVGIISEGPQLHSHSLPAHLPLCRPR